MRTLILFFLCLSSFSASYAQPFTRADSLRGNYGRFRANNDLLFYDLQVRINPADQTIRGTNAIRMKMLKSDNRIQLDLYANLNIERVVWRGQEVAFQREGNAFFVQFPQGLPKGSTQTVTVHYQGTPKATSRFGGFKFDKTPDGKDWIYTACQDVGASVWWPNKEQWKDEPDSMRIRVEVPKGLTNVSNGRFRSQKDLPDGFTRFDYYVHYPINNYNVSVNIAPYTHFGERYKNLSLDYYVLPANLEKAKIQFAQVKPMMGCFEKYFGAYPFPKDGYKLIEVPYSGMEHQTAVTYGNRYANGYLERDWTGVGISPKFDFIIIHETGHEWFGNQVGGQDRADMWIHEALDTYAEAVYVECLWGYDEALRYVNGYAPKVRHDKPIIAPYGVAATGAGGDMYFKGTLFLNTLRHVVNNDALWWKLWRQYGKTFHLKTITAEEVIAYFNRQTNMNLRPLFDQYLRTVNIPVLEMKQEAHHTLIRWRTDIKNFSMPLEMVIQGKRRRLTVNNMWRTLPNVSPDAIKVDTERFYIRVEQIPQ